ncbi:MAG: 4Fe-4S binding protein [Bacteroidales bacterium]|nr:4Fe-4S binding protein [Bacteroidales bacterium]
MLKKIRIAAAVLFWIGITLLFLDFTGVLHGYLSWMAKIQFLPAVLALNVGVIAGLILLTLILGRVYCSVICPLGVTQDAISHLRASKSKAPFKYHKEMKILRYGIWVAYVACLVAGVHVIVALLAPYGAYGRILQSIKHPVVGPTLIVAAVTLIIIAILSFKGGRSYCNSICPVGTTLSFFSRFAMFRPVIDRDKCKHCKACEHHCKARCIEITKDSANIDYSRCVDCFNCLDSCKFGALEYRFAWRKEMPGQAGHDAVGAGHDTEGAGHDAEGTAHNVMADPDRPSSGRRAFMAGTAIAVGAAALKGVEARAQEAAKKVDGGFAEVLPKTPIDREIPITPPGSKSVKDFYRHCIACQLCVVECPNGVLRPSSNPDRLMQPEMGYEKGFCRPECTRCSEVCPAGAIEKITREEKTEYRIGTASANLQLCISATGKSHCGKCASKCPVGAIHMVEIDGFRGPAVNEEICIGCGACEQYCPVRPISAITVNGRREHV